MNYTLTLYRKKGDDIALSPVSEITFFMLAILVFLQTSLLENNNNFTATNTYMSVERIFLFELSNGEPLF